MSVFDIKKSFDYGIAALLIGLSLYFAFNSAFQGVFRGFVQSEQRIVLSKLSSDLGNAGETFDILKVSENGLLKIEIFRSRFSESPELIQKIDLPPGRDGYLMYQDGATSLAAADINHDGSREVLAPTFDSNLLARLNIVKFDPIQKNFYLVIQPPSENL